MQNCFFENDAQEWHTLDTAEWPAAFDPSQDVEAVRFELRQPCPTWRQFGLAEIKCYCVTRAQAGKDLTPEGKASDVHPVPDHVLAVAGYCGVIQGELSAFRAARAAKQQL